MKYEASSKDIHAPKSLRNSKGSESWTTKGIGIIQSGDLEKVGKNFKSSGFLIYDGKYVLTTAHSLLTFELIADNLKICRSEPKYFKISEKSGQTRLRIKKHVICKEWKTFIYSKLKDSFDLCSSLQQKCKKLMEIQNSLFNYDYALLEIEDSIGSVIQLEVCRQAYLKEEKVIVQGFISDHELTGGQTKAYLSENGTINYQRITSEGNSGTPIVARINGKVKAIGIHKASTQKESIGIPITQQIIDDLNLMRENLQNWQNNESLEWEMNNNALYRYYDFNSNTIVRTKEKNSKLVLLTLQRPIERPKAQIFTFSLRYAGAAAISFGVVDQNVRFREFQSFANTSECQGMVVFTSSNGRRSAGSRIYECGSLVSGEDQKFPSLKTIESDFKEEVELIVNLKEERYLIWRVKGVEEEMKVTLNEKQFPLNSELYLFVSMPEECRVRVRKIYRSSITF